MPLRKPHQKGKAHRVCGTSRFSDQRWWGPALEDDLGSPGQAGTLPAAGPGLATTATDSCARAFRVVCNLAAASSMPR